VLASTGTTFTVDKAGTPVRTTNEGGEVYIIERCRNGAACSGAHPHRKKVELTDCPVFLLAAKERARAPAPTASRTGGAGTLLATASNASVTDDVAEAMFTALKALHEADDCTCRMRHNKVLHTTLLTGVRVQVCAEWCAGRCSAGAACSKVHPMDIFNPREGGYYLLKDSLVDAPKA
jgi:hypothetical protein